MLLKVLSVANYVCKRKVDMIYAPPDPAMAGVLVIDPILTRIEQPVAIHAVGVSAHIRSEVMENMVTGTMLVSVSCDKACPPP